MDYLDPRKKQAHKRRLLVGYFLIAIAIGISTLLVVYLANGYYVNRDTGQVIQNGLVYVDAEPGGAEIYINGEKQRGSTDARLVIPAGLYDIELKKEGYRNWARSLILEGGSLRKLTYPKLIPNELEAGVETVLRADPVSALQSIDKRWLVLSYANTPLEISVVDTESEDFAVRPIQIPENIVPAQLAGSVEFVEWADDDKSLIAKYTSGTSVNYILVDIENPTLAINLNTLLGDQTYKIQFADRKKDNFFVYQPSTQSLFTASVTNGLNRTPILTKVIDYKTFNSDWILYLTAGTEPGMVESRFKRGDKDILIKKLKTSDKYYLQLAKLGNAPVMGVASAVENRAIVYNDPEKYLNENPGTNIPLATTVLRVNNLSDLRISTDSSIIMAYGPDNFASHEFDFDRSYNFRVSVPVDSTQELRWMDGQHFLFNSGSKQVMMDFDGSNMYELVSSVPKIGSFYTNNLSVMMTVSPAIVSTDVSITKSSKFVATNLFIAADR